MRRCIGVVAAFSAKFGSSGRIFGYLVEADAWLADASSVGACKSVTNCLNASDHGDGA